MATKKRVWPWVLGVVLLGLLGGVFGLYRYWLVPYEPGRWHQVWTVTVASGSRSESSTGFGDGRCGEEGPDGATSAKQGALARACAVLQLCPGDAVCDCASRAKVEMRCEAGQSAGRTRLGDRIIVPVH